MNIEERIGTLRKLMQEWGWYAAVTVGEDPHNSEYTPSRWHQRNFISGFTGDAGVVVITPDHAGLWVDSRYHIQAANELKDSCVTLHRMVSVEDCEWMDWLAERIPSGGVIGVDGLCMSLQDAARLQSLIEYRNGRVVSRADYLETIWQDRPTLPQGKVWLHEEQYSGRSTTDKLKWMRGVLREHGCSYALVSCLDQIGWLLNIRSSDVDYCPFVISFAIVTPEGVELFAGTEKFSSDIAEALAQDGIHIHPYGDVSGFISSMKPSGRIMIDPATLNYELGKAVEKSFSGTGIVRMDSPVDIAKAVKNDVEIAGFRKAYVLDGIAQTRFFHWLEDEMAAGRQVSEADASDRLHELRAGFPDFLDESFETASAYQQNAALPHYCTIRGKDAMLRPCGVYLNDSGAHYRFGTTDITRTVPLGPMTRLEREDYTIDLKGMIDLSMAVFPVGTPGCRIDAICRNPLWQTMRNFGHGTGHGVGNVLSVHEGPQSIRQNLRNIPMKPGMITSNEPGIYREGMHGIRHENMILCVPAGENEFGSWLRFETLTLTYFDTAPILRELLDEAEIRWLNDFNASVYEKISPHLDRYDADWLYSKTRPI